MYIDVNDVASVPQKTACTALQFMKPRWKPQKLGPGPARQHVDAMFSAVAIALDGPERRSQNLPEIIVV